MKFDEYQKFTRETAVYPKQKAFEYLILGLCSEAGEVAGKLKKVIRGDKVMDTEEIVSELGDVLWYVARIADELDVPLSRIARENNTKLLSRKERGVIKGDGDRR